MAQANGKMYSVTGGFSVSNLMEGVKYLTKNQVPVGSILMTQSMYADSDKATVYSVRVALGFRSGQR